jgi:hypothetical protein
MQGNLAWVCVGHLFGRKTGHTYPSPPWFSISSRGQSAHLPHAGSSDQPLFAYNFTHRLLN